MNDNLKCLQLGCSLHVIPGWINTDVDPQKKGIIFLDVTKRFNYENETFDYIFAEHLVEHLGYDGLSKMLNECFRTLKNNGVLRISFPTLDFLTKLCTNPNQYAEYIKWSYGMFCRNKRKYAGIEIDNENPEFLLPFVIDNFTKSWGHQFIPNYSLIIEILKNIGFKSVKICNYGESEHELLNNIEQHHVNFPLEHILTETTCIEATKLE